MGDSLGILDGLKGFYFAIEEGYYGALDKVNEHLPVYDVIDPIDKIVPSMVLFGVLALVAAGLAGFALLGGIPVGPGEDTLIVTVKDKDSALGGASVTFKKIGETKAIPPVETDSSGKASMPGLKSGDSVEVSVSVQGYLDNTKIILIDALPQSEVLLMEKESEAFTTKTIRLIDSELGLAVKESLTLRFSCSNPYAKAPENIALKPSDNGTADVQVPNNCDRLSVSISDGSKYREINGRSVDRDDLTIRLAQDTAKGGTLTASVTDLKGSPVDGIAVKLYKYDDLVKNSDVGPIDQSITSGGKAVFSVSPGAYKVRTYDSAGVYGEQASGNITVGADEAKAVLLSVSENVRGTIKVWVSDRSTSRGIPKATVKLVFASNGAELSTAEADSNGTASFGISRDVEYHAFITANNYQLGKLTGLRITSGTVNAALARCTSTTCGSIIVKVVDQDGTAIGNSIVALYDARTNSLSGHPNRVSDINGVAKFFGVSAGNYYAFAFREGYSGKSDAGFFSGTSDQNRNFELTVRVDVGIAAVQFNVHDAQGRQVPFAQITLLDARTGEIIASDFTDSNGMKQFDALKANRKVYAIVYKQDEQVYATYTTAKAPLEVSTVRTFDVTLEKPVLKDNIEFVFLGLYEGGKLATKLNAGDTYTAKFKLYVPEEKRYREAGIHIRTGTDVLLEKDRIFIGEVNSPNTSQVRATRFEPEASRIDEQGYAITAGDAKWVNLRWNSPNPGIYEVEAQVTAKDNASLDDKLPMHYRAWGVKGDGTRDRFPQDDTVGIELYSNTKQEIFQVGVVSLCDEDFCFTSTVKEVKPNESESIAQSITDTFNAKAFNPYRLIFVITNNSDTRIHNSAVLQVRNPDRSLKFFGYTFIDAASRETKGVANDYNFQSFGAGNMQPHNSVRLETDFTPQKAINGIISIRLISDNAVAFEKNLTIATGAPNELEVDVEPKVYLSGVQNDIIVTAKDKATGLEVTGATAKLLDRRGNVLAFTATAADGTAGLTVPGGAPGEKYRVIVEKPDYNIKEVEISVSDQLLDIAPPQIGASLNTKTKQESADKVSVTSLVPYALTIREVRLDGAFRNMLDMQKVRNWLDSSYKGMILAPREKQDIILKTFVSQDAIALAGRGAFEGTLVLVAGNFGQQWVFNVPVKVSIGTGGEVDNPACLAVTKSSWETSSDGTPKRVEFQIQNNCTVGGKPVGLRNLEAQVKWNSNQIGEYALNIGTEERVLRQGYFRLLLGNIQPEQTLNSYLTFTPFGGVNGLSDAEIIIQASNPLDDQDQVLTHTLKTKITAVNIAECITYDKERISINQDQSGTVTITANDCGEPVNFALNSDLKTSPSREFTLKPGEAKSIEVFAEKNYPGQYGLFISPKFSSEKKKQLVKDIKVIINQPGCWQLSKYEFDVYDSPKNQFDGFDTADLANSCVEKPVDVKVNTKDFIQALKNGAFWGLVSGSIVMATNVADGRTLTGKPAPEGYSAWDKLTFGLFSSKKDDKKQESGTGSSDEGAAGIDVKPVKASGGTGGGTPAATQPGSQNNGATTVIDNSATAPGSPGGGATDVLDDRATATGQVVLPAAQGFAVVTGLASEPARGGQRLQELSAESRNKAATPQQPQTAQTGAKPAAGTGTAGNIPATLASGAGSSVLGSLFSGGGSLFSKLLGTSPWGAGIAGAAIGTLASYMSQDPEAHFTVMAKDAELQDVKLVLGAGSLQQDDPSIKLEVQGLGEGGGNAPVVPQPLVNNADLVSQGIQTVRLIFTNIGGKLITTYERPHYSLLNVNGIRHKYTDKVYEKDDFFDEEGGFLFFFQSNVLNKTKSPLAEDKAQQLEQKFRLEFNSVPPEVEKVIGGALLNCQDGTRIGSTGSDALPKVSFGWSWSGNDKQCNEDSASGVYCDSTQFSIALLKKIQQIDAYVSGNGPQFKCPSPSEDTPVTSVIENFDIGISSIKVLKAGQDATVQAKVKNTNPGTIQARVSFSARNPATNSTIQCAGGQKSITVAAGGETEAECEFKGLPAGLYEAKAEIAPSISCENCLDKSATNALTRTFIAGTSGAQQCEPYSTARLEDFLNASGMKATSIVALTSFNALLMADGYSSDFQHDFDEAQNETFFSAPDYYTNKQNGLGRYFRDTKLFSFDAYSAPDFALPGPGTYHVSIGITYKDNSWQLFDARGNPNAKITISMTKLHGAEPDSPFYYLPLDGQVGVKNGRIGYGVNFNGDSIIIDNSTTPIRTVEISGSAPVNDGVLTVTKSDSFKSMQIDNRGIVAKLTRASGSPQLLFQPSNATPVILQVSKNSGSDAYAIYQVGVGAPTAGDATDIGPTLTLWNGIGASCRGFDDTVMSQQQFVPDTHGISARCALVGQNQRSKYALEFCGEPVNFGTASYETVFYTPQGQEASIQLVDVASDSAKLIGTKGSGKSLPLNGNGVTPQINTLQDVFNLVSQGYMCVSPTNINTEFFWNPKKIFEGALRSQEDAAVNACIGPKVPANKQP